MTADLLHRVRWGNVARAAAVLLALALVLLWPRLRSEATPLPPTTVTPALGDRVGTTDVAPPAPEHAATATKKPATRRAAPERSPAAKRRRTARGRAAQRRARHVKTLRAAPSGAPATAALPTAAAPAAPAAVYAAPAPAAPGGEFRP
jgi:hypothetical protein